MADKDAMVMSTKELTARLIALSEHRHTGKLSLDPDNIWRQVCREAAARLRASEEQKAAGQSGSTTVMEVQPMVSVREDVIRFVLGEAAFEGHWFGEKPLDKPMYWWRSSLRISMHPFFPVSASGVMEKALRSIAANTCCGPCQEAALVARAALASRNDSGAIDGRNK